MDYLLQEQTSRYEETKADSLMSQMSQISAVQALISFCLTVLCWCHMYNCSRSINNMAA